MVCGARQLGCEGVKARPWRRGGGAAGSVWMDGGRWPEVIQAGCLRGRGVGARPECGGTALVLAVGDG